MSKDKSGAKIVTNSKIVAELERIRSKHNGVLRPKDVLAAARNSRNPLHSQFCWDDSVAAEKYRLQQAQTLIISVKVVKPATAGAVVRVRPYTSLPSDRISGGGYRHIDDVLS